MSTKIKSARGTVLTEFKFGMTVKLLSGSKNNFK